MNYFFRHKYRIRKQNDRYYAEIKFWWWKIWWFQLGSYGYTDAYHSFSTENCALDAINTFKESKQKAKSIIRKIN